MDFIEKIVRKVLSEALEQSQINELESAYRSKISDAIRRRYEVEFSYNDGTSNPATGMRRIQVVAYGLSTAGNLVIRAFQPNGGTKRGTPKWKMFRLDRIVPNTWKPMRTNKGSLIKFDTPPGPFIADGVYNPNGDNGMSQCIIHADFELARQRRETSYLAQKANYDKLQRQNDLFKQNAERMKNPIDNEVVKRNLQNYQLHPDMQRYLQGEPIESNDKKNPSMNAMKRVARKQTFGLGDREETTKPIMKNQNNSSIPPSTSVDLSQAENNGPVYKENDKENNNKEEKI